MAAPKSTGYDIANKKTKGLKDHKKAQKEKTLAKRTTAAEKAKVKKISSAPITVPVVKVARVQEKAAGNVEIASIMKTTTEVVAEADFHQGKLRHDSAVANEVTIGPHDDAPTGTRAINQTKVEPKADNTQSHNTNVPSDHIDTRISMLNSNAKGSSVAEVKPARNDKVASKKSADNMMVSGQPFDIVAHRKALEAALYDNFETPPQMLIRCKYTASIDTEYHPVHEDEIARRADCSYDYELDEFKPTLKCLDDNRFEITPIITGLTEEDVTVRVDITPSLALHQLFGKIKGAGQAKAGILTSSVFHASHSDEPSECDEIIVNLPRAGELPCGPVSMGHMSSASGARANGKAVEAVTVESVEAEMRIARNNGSLNTPAFLDPAIVSYKIKGQAPVQVDEHAVVTSQPTSGRSEVMNLQTFPLDLAIKSPPDLSPTSSHHSRTSSPVDHQRVKTPLTHYSITPPSELLVWTTPYTPPPQFNFPNGAAFHSPGLRMNPETGDFQYVPAQQHAHPQQMRAGYYGNRDAARNWAAAPGYFAPNLAQ